jgi:TP901 family phage tail tape measure protein
MSDQLKEQIKLEVDATGIKANSLGGLLKELQGIDKLVVAVNNRMATLGSSLDFTKLAKSKQQIEDALKTAYGTKKNIVDIPAAEAFKMVFGVSKQEVAQMVRWLNTQKADAFQGFSKKGLTVDTIGNATALLQKAATAQMKAMEDAAKSAFQKVRAGGGTGGGDIKVDGEIGLRILGSQIKPTIEGPIVLNLKGADFQTSASGGGAGGSPPAVGTAPAGGGGGGGKKSRRKAAADADLQPLDIPKQDGEISRTTTRGADGTERVAVTMVDAAGKKTTQVFSNESQTAGAYRTVERAARAGSFGPYRGTGMMELPGFQGAQQAAFVEQFSAAGGLPPWMTKAFFKAGAPAPAVGPGWRSAQRPTALQMLMGQPALPNPGPGIVPLPPGPPAPKPGKIQSALQTAFGPTSFAAHTIKAAGWAAAITAIYKPIQLAEYSLHRFLDLGEQTAHLDVIFKKIGGSTKELADDVMKLAAANGRSTDEAMESAQEWARLGLNRVQINEAVRVSLVAANVAQISVGESTKQMSALMHIYAMNVGQLDNALGQLVNTPQKFNVTTEDLLGGLDRSAAAAKVAGVGFAELQGLIGATVGGTGQSGVQVGNTIKNLFTQFTRPEMRSYLQTQGIATLNGGQFANGSEVLRQMFIRYQSMNPTQQRGLGTVIAGRLQVARFAGLMNEYPEAQKLAIDGQLRLNAATETNVRIVQTLAAQWRGVRAEFDRFITKTGSQQSATEWTRFGKNVLGRVNDHLPEGGLNLGGSYIGSVFGPAAGALYHQVDKNLPFLNSVLEAGAKLSPAEKLQSDFAAAQGKFQGYAQMETFFDTAGRLNGVHTDAAESYRKTAGEYMAGLGLPAGASYRDAGSAAHAQSIGGMADMMGQMAGYKADIDERHRSGKLDDKGYQDELNMLQNLTRAIRENSDAEISSVTEQWNRRQEYVNLLKEQAGVMELIGKLSSQVSTGTLGNESDNQLRAVTANIASLMEQKKTLETNGGPMPLTDNGTYQSIVSQLSDATAQRETLESPRYQSAVTAYDHRKIAVQRADAEAGTSAVGYTEAEKLLRQREALESSLAQIEQRYRNGSATQNDITRAWELQNQLASNHEKIQQRIVELKGQEKQIVIDSVREFQKSLLMSGPGELLKRLYVGGQTGMNAGRFMSMDPESRQMYYQLHGGEAGAKNREEQWLTAREGLTVEGQQSQADRDRKDVKKWGDRKNDPTAGMPGLPPPADPYLAQAAQSALQLSAFASELTKATTAVVNFSTSLPGSSSTRGEKLPGFQRGGYTGDGPANEVAGVVHKGEVVIPADQVNKFKYRPPRTYAEWHEFNNQKNGWRDSTPQQKNDFYAQQHAEANERNGWRDSTPQQKNDFYAQQHAEANERNGWRDSTPQQKDDFYAQQAAESKKRRNAAWEDEFGGENWQEKMAKHEADWAARSEAAKLDFYRSRGDTDNGDGTWRHNAARSRRNPLPTPPRRPSSPRPVSGSPPVHGSPSPQESSPATTAATPTAPAGDPIMSAAMKLVALGSAADRVTAAFGRLEARVDNFKGCGGCPGVNTNRAPATPAPKLGVSCGHALGSTPPVAPAEQHDNAFWGAVDAILPQWLARF